MKLSSLKVLLIVILVVFGIGYLLWSSNPQRAINELNETYTNIVRNQNIHIERMETMLTEFYKRADADLRQGVSYGDSMLIHDKSLDHNDIWLLNTIIGETLYDHNSIDRALKRFKPSDTISNTSPRNQVNIASCYTKQGKYDSAMELLDLAASINSSHMWYIGNLYEVMQKGDQAVLTYQSLYQRDTIQFRFCLDRVTEIVNRNAPLFTELHFRNRRQRTYLTMDRGLLIFE